MRRDRCGAALVYRAAVYTNYYGRISNTWRLSNKSESRRMSKHPQVPLGSSLSSDFLSYSEASSKFRKREKCALKKREPTFIINIEIKSASEMLFSLIS